MNFLIRIFIFTCKYFSKMLQFEIIALITRICNGTTSHIEKLIQEGVIPHLKRFLKLSPNIRNLNLLGISIWCVGNISNDSYFKILLVEQRFPDDLVRIIRNNTLSLKITKYLSFAMHNLMRNVDKLPNKLNEIVKWLPALHIFLDHEELSVKCDSIFAISHILYCGEAEIDLLLKNGFCEKIISNMDHDNEVVGLLALRIIGLFLCGTQVQIQVFQRILHLDL